MPRSLCIVAVLSLMATMLFTPVATAQAPVDLPEGALGNQIQWVVDLLNGDPAQVTADEVEAHVSPEVLAGVSAETLALTLLELSAEIAPAQIEPGSLVSEGAPPARARFVLAGEGGVRYHTSITVEPGSGLIAALWFSPAPAAGAPVATPLTIAPTDVELTFESGGDIVYGSLMTPANVTSPAPAALIISGSGPTDRNGNSAYLTSINTNLHLAHTLADQGVISFRYDKLGSGKTGLGSRAQGDITASMFLQEVQDAADFLVSQPGVDPSRLILVGHSEGALFSLMLAWQMSEVGNPPAALILVTPLSIPYLDLIEEQLAGQYGEAVAAGQVTQERADATMAELDVVVESLRTTGRLPEVIHSGVLASIFTPLNASFVAEADSWHPAEVAASLPTDMPVLVMHAGKDEQVTRAQVQQLVAGFTTAGNHNVRLIDLPDANHFLRVVEGKPNADVDYLNPSLLFDPAAVQAIATFLERTGLAPVSTAGRGETRLLAGSS
jgi:alpha-beta hydrolase superfamily lysophospholipase